MPHANILQRTRHKLTHNAITEFFAELSASFAEVRAKLLAAAYAEGVAEGIPIGRAQGIAEGRAIAAGRAEMLRELLDQAPPAHREWLEQIGPTLLAKPRPRL